MIERLLRYFGSNGFRTLALAALLTAGVVANQYGPSAVYYYSPAYPYVQGLNWLIFLLFVFAAVRFSINLKKKEFIAHSLLGLAASITGTILIAFFGLIMGLHDL